MYRYFDAAFSHRLLVLLPLILVPLMSAVAAVVVGRSYEVTATIWVDPAIQLGGSPDPALSKEANEIEGSALQEWLATESFVTELISRSSGTSVLQDRAVEVVRKSLRVEWSGSRIVKVSYRGENPELGVRLVGGAIDLFNEKRGASRIGEARVAGDFLEEGLREPQRRFTEAADALRRFRESHPVPEGQTLSAADQAELANLENLYSTARDLYGSAQVRLQESRLAVNADLLRTQNPLKVVDPPEAPGAMGLDENRVLIFSLVGLAAGLILSLVVVVWTGWTDGAVRSAEDLRHLSDLPLLATIPHLAASPRGSSGISAGHPVRDWMAEAAGAFAGPRHPSSGKEHGNGS